jgi:hypothetical protein
MSRFSRMGGCVYEFESDFEVLTTTPMEPAAHEDTGHFYGTGHERERPRRASEWPSSSTCQNIASLELATRQSILSHKRLTQSASTVKGLGIWVGSGACQCSPALYTHAGMTIATFCEASHGMMQPLR